jgi:Uma2 family endonuclease
MKPTTLEPAEIEYPETDGKPMAETDWHRDVMAYLIDTAAYRFRDQPDAYVSGNILVYYVEGNPRKRVSPDFLFVRGVPRRKRRVYKTWEEGKGLDVTVEVTSRKTHKEDLGGKLETYERLLGVQEYYLFDPDGEHFDPPLRGFRRVRGKLRPLESRIAADGAHLLSSEVLGLDLHALGKVLRWVDPRTGEPLLSGDEARDRLAEARRAAARAEAENARLRAALERRRRGK